MAAGSVVILSVSFLIMVIHVFLKIFISVARALSILLISFIEPVFWFTDFLSYFYFKSH